MRRRAILLSFSRKIGVNLTFLAGCILTNSNAVQAVDINVAATVEGAVAIADSEYGADSQV